LCSIARRDERWGFYCECDAAVDWQIRGPVLERLQRNCSSFAFRSDLFVSLSVPPSVCAVASLRMMLRLCPCVSAEHAASTSASVEPAQLGMPAPLSRPSRVSALPADIVDLARRRAPTAALAMRARLHPAHPLLPQPFALLVRSAALVTRYARTAPPLPALAVAADQRRPSAPCALRVSLVSEMGRRAVTAVQGMHALLGQRRRPLLQPCVPLVASV
jgi:hypothetical protein